MPPKRKSDAGESSGSSSKKLRGSNPHASAIVLVNDILSNPDAYPIAEDDETIRQSLVEMAQYARFLEGQLANAGPAPPAAKTQEELEVAAEKIRKAANAGIRKQMSWKPSCKTGSAKWCYDGICPDPAVFGILMGLGGPPKWKMKKIPANDFENLIGAIDASARYSDLRITSTDVNVRWSETGEFKFSGSYGV